MRRRLLPVTFGLALVLSACGSGGDETTDPTTAASASASASASPSAAATPTVDDSLCARLDPKDATQLAKVFDQAGAFGKVSLGASVYGPPMETCTFSIGKGDTGAPLTLGWSAVPDARAIAKVRKYQQKTNGRYTEIKDVKAPGVEGAFLVSRTGYGQIGDRVVSVLFAGATDVSANQMSKAMRIVAGAATDLPEWDVSATVPACEGADAEVAAVLGGEPTFVRGTTGADGATNCSWSTGDNGLTVSQVSMGDNAAQMLADDKEFFGGKDVAGLGKRAVFVGGEDGLSLKVLVDDQGTITQFVVPALMSGDQKSLVALARKLLPNF